MQRDARGVVRLTLNDPQRFNALGEQMLTQLQQALDDVARDESVRVVVLAAAGKAFAPDTISRTWRPIRSWTTTRSCSRSAAA